MRAPATANARRRPNTPSPARISPRPVSHADNTVHSADDRSIDTISSAVRMPSSASARVPARRFAPAIARPDKRSGLAVAGGCAPASPPTPRLLPPAPPHPSPTTNPCVARCRIRRPGACCLKAVSVAPCPARWCRAAAVPLACFQRSTTAAASRAVPGSGSKRTDSSDPQSPPLDPAASTVRRRIVALAAAGTGPNAAPPSASSPPDTPPAGVIATRSRSADKSCNRCFDSTR